MSHTITWDNLNSAGPIFDMDKMLQDGIFIKNVLLRKLLDKKKTYEGGEYVTSPIYKDRGTAFSYSDFDENPVQDKEIITTAEWPVAHYAARIAVSYTEMLANQGSQKKVFDLMEAKYNNAMETLSYFLTTALYLDGQATATDLKPLIGLAAAVDIDPTSNPTMGAYGSITRDATSATTFWKNQINDQSGGGLSGFTDLSILQTLWGLCSDGDVHPDLIVTTQTIYNKCWSLSDSRQRLGNEDAAKLGYSSIDFNGVPLMVDNNCTAGYLYMINTDTLELVSHSSDNFKPWPFMMGLTKFVQKKDITWSGQLKCKNPRRNGVMWGLV